MRSKAQCGVHSATAHVTARSLAVRLQHSSYPPHLPEVSPHPTSSQELAILGSHLEKLSLGSIRRHRGSTNSFINSFVLGTADVCRLVPIIWFQLFLTKLLGNMHGAWTTKYHFPSWAIQYFIGNPVFHCSSFEGGQSPHCSILKSGLVFKVKLATTGLNFRSSRKSFFLFVFFFQSVHKVRKTVCSGCLHSTRHPHRIGTPESGSSAVPYGQVLDGHKPERRKQTDVETHPNKGNFLQN